MTRLASSIAQFRQTARDSGLAWALSLAVDRILPAGVLRLWGDRVVSAPQLGKQLEAILRAWGMPDEHVQTTAEHLLWADLRGIDSHGSAMMLHYHRELIAGLLKTSPTVEVVRQGDATALIDGGGGLGHVPARLAMQLAITKCGDSGLAAVAVRNSGHYGAAGIYAAMAADAGFIGLATTSTRRPAVVPTRAAAARLGTNPLAFAAPAARNPAFLLDMATSTASLGKLTTAWRKGRSLPAGWAIDAKGNAVTDGRVAAEQRRLTPLGSSEEMGGHKGYGLATLVQILSSSLPGGDGPVGHFLLAIDPRRFRADGEFEADVDGLIDSLRSTPALDPAKPVLVAGDPEQAAYAQRSRDGIPLSRSTLEDLRQVARASGVAFGLDHR